MSVTPPSGPPRTPGVGGPTAPVGPATPQAVATPQTAAVAATPEAPLDPATLLLRALDGARAEAATRQGAATALLADLPPALAAKTTAGDVKAAIRQVLAFGLSSASPPDAAALKTAVAQSGLFLEARLAQAPPPPGAPPIDLKAALLVLQQALAGGPALARSQPPKGAAPPPTKAAAVKGQPPGEASLTVRDPPARVTQMLRDETDQALARQTLHQLASVPDDSGQTRWMFELPLMTPQGAAIAQFAVERDGAGRGETGEATWRARFALDVPPLGPIEVHLRMQGERSHAVLWVEREESLAQLQAQAGELTATFAGDVVFHAGTPPAPPSGPPGQLVDRTS